MGLRLYITTSEEKDKCFGKLYGYAGKTKHLYSLDYLIEIDAFKDWKDKIPLFDTTSYEDMVEYFVCAQVTDEIYLTPEQYIRFILLYRSDQSICWDIEARDILNHVSKSLYMGEDEDKKIKLEWY